MFPCHHTNRWTRLCRGGRVVSAAAWLPRRSLLWNQAGWKRLSCVEFACPPVPAWVSSGYSRFPQQSAAWSVDTTLKTVQCRILFEQIKKNKSKSTVELKLVGKSRAALTDATDVNVDYLIIPCWLSFVAHVTLKQRDHSISKPVAALWSVPSTLWSVSHGWTRITDLNRDQSVFSEQCKAEHWNS